jgi:hypothetical protein
MCLIYDTKPFVKKRVALNQKDVDDNKSSCHKGVQDWSCGTEQIYIFTSSLPIKGSPKNWTA